MSDYDIGYGKPPTASRFKKGQSGNPKGRPKGQQNFATILVRELSETLQIKEGGKYRKITKLEAVMKQLVAKSLNGDLKAMGTLMRLIQAHWPEDARGQQNSLPPTDEDLAILHDFLARAAIKKGAENE